MKLKSKIDVSKNYTKISNEFFEGLTIDEIGLMTYLQHLSTRNFAVSSLVDISTKLSVSKRNLIRIIGNLEKKGFLEKSGERYNMEYCLKIGKDSDRIAPKDSDKIAPKDSDKIAPIVKPIVITKVKEKEVKEKEKTCFGYKYPTNDLTNEQIKIISRELKIEDRIKEHPNDKDWYIIRGEILGIGAVSRMLSYIRLNPNNKEKNIAQLLNYPSEFSQLARSM